MKVNSYFVKFSIVGLASSYGICVEINRPDAYTSLQIFNMILKDCIDEANKFYDDIEKEDIDIKILTLLNSKTIS